MNTAAMAMDTSPLNAITMKSLSTGRSRKNHGQIPFPQQSSVDRFTLSSKLSGGAVAVAVAFEFMGAGLDSGLPGRPPAEATVARSSLGRLKRGGIELERAADELVGGRVL